MVPPRKTTVSVELPAIRIIYCQQARELLDALAEPVRELVRLHEDQFQALIGDDQDGTRFDDLIHIANERKREAKYENLTHLEMGESTNSDKHQQ